MTAANIKNDKKMTNLTDKNLAECNNQTQMEVDVESLKLLKANSQLIQTTFKSFFKYGNLVKTNEKSSLSRNTSGVKQELFLNGPMEYREKARNYINALCQPEFIQFVSVNKSFLKEKIESNPLFANQAMRDYQVYYYIKDDEIVLNGRVDDVNKLKSRIQTESSEFLKSKSPDEKKKESVCNAQDEGDDDIIFICSKSSDNKLTNEPPRKAFVNMNETPQVISDNSIKESDSNSQSPEFAKHNSNQPKLNQKDIDDDIEILDTISLADSLNVSLKIENVKFDSFPESQQVPETHNETSGKFDQRRLKFQNKMHKNTFTSNLNHQNRINKSKFKKKQRNNNFRYFHHIIPEVQSYLNNKNDQLLSKNLNLKNTKRTIQTMSTSELRFIVIDGNNVAIEHGKGSGNGKAFSAKGLKLVVEYFLARGHNQIKIFVPRFRRGTSDQNVPTRNPEILDELEEQGYLAYTPSRFVNQKLILPYDDRFIIKAAIHHNAVIVSNDNFRDLQDENPEWKTYIQRNLLQFTYVGDLFMVADDPFGKGGPSLSHFLTNAFK
jgi:hypothetical protein